MFDDGRATLEVDARRGSAPSFGYAAGVLARSRPLATSRNLLLLALPILIAGVALWRWRGQSAGPSEATESTGPLPVEVRAVEVGAITDELTLFGTLEPSVRVALSAEVAGTLEAVRVDLGDSVEPGQVVALIDDAEYRQQERAARADYALAMARHRAAAVEVQAATRELRRAEAMSERGIASSQSLDTSRTELARREAAGSVAQAELARATATWNQAKLQLDRTRVHLDWAAEEGNRVVAARSVDEGARVAVGDSLVTLVDSDPLILSASVGPEAYRHLRVGQTVHLRLSGEDRSGRVARMAPTFDIETRQARVEVEVDNSDSDLQPGIFVQAQIVVRRVEGAKLVPDAALATRDGRPVVFVARDGTAHQVAVEVGLRSEGKVELVGFDSSDPVVTLGLQRLTDGAAIRLVGEAP